jgi:hypothetical protein
MEHDRTLDEEGVPDLEGPLPGKAHTGDPQEGLAPPNERPRASVDIGTTAAEQEHGESLDRRLAREEPEEGRAPEREGIQLVEDDESERDGLDVESEMIADEVDDEDGELLSPEEAALHVEDDA